MKQESITRLYERKKFFRLLFGQCIGPGNNLKDNQYIRILQTLKKPVFFTNIDDLNTYLENHRFGVNTYFNLATTDGISGRTESLKYRYFLAWDFDKKLQPGIKAKDIMFKFKEVGLWYHAIIDSGHGYHVYMVINKTNDFGKISEVTKAIGMLLGADIDAMLNTQVLRVPYTYNVKSKPKQVNIIKMFTENVKPYDIDNLFRKYCNRDCENKTDRTIQYMFDKTKIPPCIAKILEGVEDGDRNFAIKRLISFLKLNNYSESETYNIIKEWNYKNKPEIEIGEMDYQFKYIWEKGYSCFGCRTKDERLQSQISKYCNIETCKSSRKDAIQFVAGETIQIEYKICKKFEKQRNGVFQLKGNHLLLIGLLKNNESGLNTDEIVKKLSYIDKQSKVERCCISSKTLGLTLNELTNNGYITRIKGNKRNKEKDFFKMNHIKCMEIEKFYLSYYALLGVVKGDISSEDLKIYCYMRYKLSKNLSVIQEKLAEELGLSQSTISFHINNLVREKYLEIIEVDYSVNPLGVNVYRVNC